ncbi:hypothetical protein O3G_MSEX004171 [Manduca sexta]|uniref:Uncharacterized protein n=1 Tax=Manduca sexta TaxID=7130 RepID=A0A921YVU5_MANSE|nr:hypothetical protein O3G_MSEX004171 [Manduca sexta]
MNHNNKDQVVRDIVCRSHSARSERDLYRVCPSKLNKRELEDLYFALLENNLELKRTINGQRDQIKTLSTKVQRMSATQKGSFGRESRECCLTTKAVVNEQKDMIAELKKSNERMSERIRLLNMRLCSAKQFVKRSPSQLTTRCIKCSTQTATSPKNSSSIALTTNISESNLKTTGVSCHDLVEKDVPSTRSVQTETNEEHKKEDQEIPCEENKCRTLMEELKQKIINLQEELSTTHMEYSSRIGRLEMEVSSLQARDREGQEIASRLTRAEIRNGELAMELAIEKGKVAELETSVKAAQMSSKVAATIEGHLATINQARRESYCRPPLCSPCCPAEWEERSPRLQALESTPTKAVSSVEFRLDNYDIKPAKNSDDSGYTDANKSTEMSDDKGLNKINQELMKKIVELQTQLDQLQVTATGESIKDEKSSEQPLKSDELVNGKLIEPLTLFVKNKGFVIIEPVKDDIITERSVKVEDIKKNELNSEQSTTNALNIVNEQSSTIIPVAKYPLVWLSDGQKNLEDTDEGSYTIQPSDKPPTPEAKPDTPEPAKDDHNKYQIPGPIASDTNKANKHVRRQSIDKGTISRSKECQNEVEKDSNTQVQCSSAKNTQEEDKTAVNFISNGKDIQDVDNVSVKFIDDKTKKDSIEIMKQRLTKKSSRTGKSIDMPLIAENRLPENNQDHSLTNYYVDPTKSNRILSMEQSRNLPEKKDTLGTQMDYQAAVENYPSYKPPVVDVPATYTVQSEGRTSRTSEKDTDHEISAMTDLSTERGGTSPSPLSPGEDKPPSGSRSHSAPTTDYGTLSEGELPTVARARKLSVGERPMTDITNGTHRKFPQQNMEEALHAITEELARCKQLLHQQRQHQRGKVKSVDADVTADLCPAPIALKRAPGNQRIGDTFTPKCIFTLHIGTVVLSDEAVLNSRDMSLVLTWKFYDQNLAMTRMRAGRVVLFDFSTEYDVKITDDFLNYMKQEEMPIIICELDKQDEPFASCALPLREALLHTNRRADMSLALVAGPQLRLARGATDSLDGGDEVGVLDLWCMLRAEPRLLPAINRAIARPAPSPQPSSASRIMEQVLADDHSDRLSQELELHVGQLRRGSGASQGVGSSRWNTRDLSVVTRVGPFGKESDTPSVVPAYDYYDVHKYPVVRRRSSQKQRKSGQSDSLNTDFGPKRPAEFAPKKIDEGFKWQSPFQNITSSGIIINEVPANIKSTEEMKQALKRNVQASNQHVASKLKGEEVGSQTPSSLVSLVNKPEKLDPAADTLKEKRKRSSRFSFLSGKVKKPSLDAPRSSRFIQNGSDQEISRKYDNISRIIGSCRMQDNSKKSVTINHKYCETTTKVPQKDVAEEPCHNQSIDITVLWLALNEECEAMMNPRIQRLYVAYSFLGRSGAELETPVSLPKPKHYVEKCFFNFKKSLYIYFTG